MKKLWLSESMISRAFWQELEASSKVAEARKDSQEVANLTSPLVDRFPSVAGSISLDSSFYLWLLTKYFSPKNICEVGTYIGRSTLIMLAASGENLERIYTCDGTYDCMDFSLLDGCNLPDSKTINRKKISYFGKTMSTEMLEKIREQNFKIDFCFIDGRITNEDCVLLEQLFTDDAVIVIDDFEGVEKGVVNVMMLRNKFSRHVLLEPPVLASRRQRLNFSIMVPARILSISRQQSLPVSM